jgi:hypothetical protein
MNELETFTNFARLKLEEYALEHIGSKYEVWQYRDRILIRKHGDSKRVNGLPSYTICVII